MLRDSTIAIVVVRMCHDNMRKSIHGFPLFPYMGMGFRLAAPGAPLLP